MAKHKLQRFAENETFTNLFQHHHYDIEHTGFPLRGHWYDYFNNHNPIIVELGCGRGEYTVAMSQRYPEKNFIGIDRKGARIWRGCKDAGEKQLSNVAFIRAQIGDIASYFAPGEVSEIWVTFPDPQIKKERHRLVSPIFMKKYCQVWGNTGILHLKTDSRFLYEYVLETAPQQQWEILENIEDVYHTTPISTLLTEIQTFYEKKWLQEEATISYVKLGITNSL